MRDVEVDRHESDHARWEMVRASPARALWPGVWRYWGFCETSRTPIRRREVPSGDVSVIVGFGQTISVRSAGGAPRGDLCSFTIALGDAGVVTEHAGRHHGVEIDLSPLGCYQLFGVPVHELTNVVVPLGDLWGRSAEVLADRMHATPDWQARFDLLDEFLGARLVVGPRPQPEIVWAWTRLRASAGRSGIRELGGELGWSPRRLIRAFRTEVGLAPKTYAQVLRFGRAAGQLRAGGVVRIADVALDCGYFDQAHLSRDFRRFAGTTPSDYLARLLPDAGGVSA